MARDSKHGLNWSAAGILAAGAAGAIILRRELAARRSLRGQVAVIMGGSRGLGLALARLLADEGCKLAICGRDEDSLERAQAELTARGAQVLALPCDVEVQVLVTAFITAVEAHYGQIDILINNAATIQVAPVEALTLRDFEEAMGVMYWGTVYATMAALPAMRARGDGQIINITSIGGKVPVPHLMPYVAAKFAATGFSEGLRAELKNAGISVTTIIPGLMRTGAHLHAQFKGDERGEYIWFTLGDTLPFSAISAERAAWQILGAIKRRSPEHIISTQAFILAKLFALFPGATTEFLGLVDRFLPKAHVPQSIASEGAAVEQRSGLGDNAAWKAVTALGDEAAGKHNQFGE